ncbi:C40 family peptidase [Mucilaginibacter sp. X4EP1]|uniref:C40 family peptidase n=1 Tax=Mucilaginibacter sp. X4EP1 TaxID=2723092 RepID=UPI00216A30FA|nr:C40 family peptidase [Mucilaginibacter sp. X4EP1]MCS3815222.1 cell wall-associated NlpC family hydrolase [Mucilaginibacter sp. X4EP1]
MRNFSISLIIVFCLTAMAASNALARKSTRHHRPTPARVTLNNDTIPADSILHFAQSLIGVRYRSATSDPLRGFDCSGFVSYVFKSFNFNVPRSSCEFINVGEKIRLEDAKPGDIILFTGTKKHTHKIGHIGIVFCNDGVDNFTFIHSTSGKEHGVTITAMDKNYRRRYVQIVRILKQNDV